MAVPGRYTVSVEQWVDGAVSELAPPTPFEVEPLGLGSLPAPDRAAVLAFQQQTGALQRAVMGTNAAASEAADRLSGLKEAVESWPGADPALRMEARTLELRLMDLREKLTGDQTRADRNEPEMPGLMRRLQGVIGGHWSTTYGPTATHRRNYEIAAEEFGAIYDQLKQVIEVALPALEQRIEATGAPIELKYRLPVWRP